MKNILIFLILMPLIGVCQTQIQVPLTKGCPYGYLEYMPPCETVSENCQVVYKCPKALLISLDGFGARGNGTTDLYKVAGEGVAKIIADGKWTRKEFIVISPQLYIGANQYSKLTLNIFIKQMLVKYPVDSNQVYIVGLSGGANSIYPYITTYKGIRGAVAISGYGSGTTAAKSIPTKVWEFHGSADQTVKFSSAFHKNYNIAASTDSIKVDPAKLTLWDGVIHTGWQEVISGQWINKQSDPLYNKFDQDIFDWLLK